jgi:hypothetical protein
MYGDASRRTWPLSGRIHSGSAPGAETALCRGNASLCRSDACVATRASGRTPMSGLARPSTEVVWACFAPHVWVLGCWFGFALLCVALLCAVCMAQPGMVQWWRTALPAPGRCGGVELPAGAGKQRGRRAAGAAAGASTGASGQVPGGQKWSLPKRRQSRDVF